MKRRISKKLKGRKNPEVVQEKRTLDANTYITPEGTFVSPKSLENMGITRRQLFSYCVEDFDKKITATQNIEIPNIFQINMI
jgi:predicted nuclease of restriction endonuclease-like (RecB) superfamily